MKRNVQVLALLLAGAALLHISLLTDVYLRYVKEGLRPLLVFTAVVLLLLGLTGAALDGFPRARPRPAAYAGGHGHDHSSGPRVAWLLLGLALVLLLAAPPPLGAFTAARESDGNTAGEAQRGGAPVRFGPLPDDRPARLTLTEFTLRAQDRGGRSLRGRPVRMTGLAIPGKGRGSWDLARIVISCCAADSRSVTVRMRGAPSPSADAWVAVTGTLRLLPANAPEDMRPTLNVTDVRRVPAPRNPYRDTVQP